MLIIFIIFQTEKATSNAARAGGKRAARAGGKRAGNTCRPRIIRRGKMSSGRMPLTGGGTSNFLPRRSGRWSSSTSGTGKFDIAIHFISAQHPLHSFDIAIHFISVSFTNFKNTDSQISKTLCLDDINQGTVVITKMYQQMPKKNSAKISAKIIF